MFVNQMSLSQIVIGGWREWHEESPEDLNCQRSGEIGGAGSTVIPLRRDWVSEELVLADPQGRDVPAPYRVGQAKARRIG